MDESRILIIGAHGQLGKALQTQYPSSVAVDREILDITDWGALSQYDWTKIDIILNAAAYTNVDGAETPDGRRSAWKINALSASYLSKIAINHNLDIIHISSEYVFDGKQSPHKEDEDFSPLGVYAQTKAAGDIAISIVPKHYILRTSWLIGDGPNFVRTMISLAKKNISPKVVADQIGRLTFTTTLVNAIDHLLRKKSGYGIYNVSNEGDEASWADITRVIFKELGREDLTITNTTTKEYFANNPEVALRPLKSTLDLTKIEATGLILPDWKDDLVKYIREVLQK